jgi:hypothetical protein
MGASASLEAPALGVEPGAEASVRLRVRNTGQVVDQFAFQVLGDSATWTAVDPPTLSLFPGAEEATTVWFRPPRAPSVPAGDIPFAVRVVSREDPDGAVVEEGLVSVGSFHQTTADLTPKNSRGSRTGIHELAVDNRGNVAIEVGVRGGDPDEALSFRLRPASLLIAPGRAAFAQVQVTARQVFFSGPPRSHPFQLQVSPSGEAAIPLDGSMVQGPLVGRWARVAAMAAALALVAAAVLWFLAVKPAVESAARNAVAAPLAQQSAAIAQLQKQAPNAGAGGSAGSAASGSGQGSTPAPQAGAATGSGASFARRLDQSSGRQYRVPGGVTLSITDVVFQNPDGDHGTVQLQREGTTLLVENLDNFRDLDYHFVTPITATGNQVVQMSVQCSGSCTSVGVYLNGSERPS